MDRHSLNIPERIETERLFLRPYGPGDGAMYLAASLRNKDHLSEYEAENVLMDLKSEEHAESVVRELGANWIEKINFFFGIFDQVTDEWAGQVYVGPTNWELPEFSIGYVADARFQGRGYIPEAVAGVLRMLFTDGGALRVSSECDERNVRSWRLLERCGFIREGHRRENKRNPDGTLGGDYLYSMLRREYADS